MNQKFWQLPRKVAEFIEPAQVVAVRRIAQLNYLLPLLRVSIALVWIVTGLISFGIYPVAGSMVLLERTGIPAQLALLMLYGAAMFDLALGIGLLFIRRKWIWRLQFALIAFYTIVTDTCKLPVSERVSHVLLYMNFGVICLLFAQVSADWFERSTALHYA